MAELSGCHSGQLDDRIIAQRRDRFQAHVSTALNRPFIVLLEQQRAHEPRDGIFGLSLVDERVGRGDRRSAISISSRNRGGRQRSRRLQCAQPHRVSAGSPQYVAPAHPLLSRTMKQASSSRRSATVAGNRERSALRGSLRWHVRGETVNPQTSSAADAIPQISLPLSGAQRTWPNLLLVRPRRE